eukprot:13738467-Alexandrium_andersonii.AAC.1
MQTASVLVPAPVSEWPRWATRTDSNLRPRRCRVPLQCEQSLVGAAQGPLLVPVVVLSSQAA